MDTSRTDERQKGKIDHVQRKDVGGLLNNYIFVGPTQLNSTAFYQIIHIQCMMVNLI